MVHIYLCLFQLSHVNLNNMLCPAVSDPFYGRLYRICGMIHQVILIPLIGKFVAATANYFKLTQPSEIPERLVFVSQPIKSSHSECLANTNGYNSKNHIENIQNGSHMENSISSKESNGFLLKDSGCIREVSSSNGHIKKA